MSNFILFNESQKHDFYATYSAVDNQLRIYPLSSSCIGANLYKESRIAGYEWEPLEKLFVAHEWTPKAANFALKLAGEIKAETPSFVGGAEDKPNSSVTVKNSKIKRLLKFTESTELRAFLLIVSFAVKCVMWIIDLLKN